MFVEPAPLPPPSAVPAQAVASLAAKIYYGGPDEPPRALREVLLARVQAAPPGSEIDWATYYFHDQGLAEALVAAQRRGVRVRVVVEARPRSSEVNDRTISTLESGLGNGFRTHRSWMPGARLHAKIYAFSGPQPEAFIGSFNPTGDAIDDPRMLRKIGDQDRGENLLVAFREPKIVQALQGEVLRLWRGKGEFRFGRHQNRSKKFEGLTLFFFPRLRSGVVERQLVHLKAGDRVQAAVSHMDRGPFAQKLAEAARRGAKIEVVVHDTKRRVPKSVVDDLRRAGASVVRYCDAERLPMHAKFVIVDHRHRRTAWFGSLNYNLGSRLLNAEVLARSTDPAIVDELEGRFRVLSDTALEHSCGAPKA